MFVHQIKALWTESLYSHINVMNGKWLYVVFRQENNKYYVYAHVVLRWINSTGSTGLDFMLSEVPVNHTKIYAWPFIYI